MKAMTVPEHRPSLVFGLVAATGTHIDPFVDVFSTLLRKYGYEPASIRLTDLLLEHAFEPGSIIWNNEGERIQKLMDAGDLLGSCNCRPPSTIRGGQHRC